MLENKKNKDPKLNCNHRNIIYIKNPISSNASWFDDYNRDKGVCKSCGTIVRSFTGFIDASPPVSPILNSPTIKT